MACNTSSTVLRKIQQEYLPTTHPDTKVLGVIRPGAESIIESHHQPVGIMATQATVTAASFTHELKKLHAPLSFYQVACPKIVPLVESGHLDDTDVKNVVKEYVDILKKQGAKSILLGCTHYELISDVIREVAQLPVMTEGWVTAEKLADYLKRHHEIESKLGKDQRRNYFFSHLDESHRNLAQRFMKEVDPVDSIEEVSLISQ